MRKMENRTSAKDVLIPVKRSHVTLEKQQAALHQGSSFQRAVGLDIKM
jgi:hypothetical protein